MASAIPPWGLDRVLVGMWGWNKGNINEDKRG